MHTGRKTKTLVDVFREYTKIALKSLISDDKQKVNSDNSLDFENIESQITMTQLEIESFYIVKSMLRKFIAPENINFIDSDTHFTIVAENNPEKWICKINLKNEKQISLHYTNDVGELSYDFESIDDLYELNNQLVDIVKNL